MAKPTRPVLYGIIALLVLFLAWTFFTRKKDGRPPMEAVPVSVAQALVQDVPQYLQGIGTVTPSADVLVTSRVTGTLTEVCFTEGDRVEAGQLLAQIDPRTYEAALAKAKGTLAKDEADLANARRDAGRYAKLAAKDYVARQTYDTQVAEVRKLEGTVQSDKAAVQSAEVDLSYTRITAPVSGRLGIRAVDPGTLITANDSTGIVRITESSPCHVVFPLPEVNITLITDALKNPEGKPLVEAWSRDQKTCLAKGYLLTTDNTIDTATGTIKLKAVFPNEDGRLFPNEFVNARLLVRTLEKAVTVPPSAVQIGASGNYVFVVGKDNAVELRTVTTALSTGAVTVISEGLKGNEKVVVDGIDSLKDKAKVNIVATVETVSMAQQPSPLATESSARKSTASQQQGPAGAPGGRPDDAPDGAPSGKPNDR